jgi:guanylate kinase
VERLLKKHPDWVRSISVTTRSPRAGEKEGRDYFFVSASDFKKREAQGRFLETAKVFNYRYGTPKDYTLRHYRQGKTIILAIDVQGTKKVKRALGNQVALLTLFILPPSMKILRQRLEGRNTETAKEIERRVMIAQEEMKQAPLYDFKIVNRKLGHAVSEIEKTIAKFRKKRR